MPSTYAPNLVSVPCLTNLGTVTVFDAAIAFRKYRAQPFNVSGSVQGPPIWSAFTMDPAYYGLGYNEQWAMTNVSFPVTYSVVSGSLPGGLSLTGNNPSTGIISGTPSAIGTFNFTLRATNADGTADQSFSIVVNAVPIGGFI